MACMDAAVNEEGRGGRREEATPLTVQHCRVLDDSEWIERFIILLHTYRTGWKIPLCWHRIVLNIHLQSTIGISYKLKPYMPLCLVIRLIPLSSLFLHCRMSNGLSAFHHGRIALFSLQFHKNLSDITSIICTNCTWSYIWVMTGAGAGRHRAIGASFFHYGYIILLLLLLLLILK